MFRLSNPLTTVPLYGSLAKEGYRLFLLEGHLSDPTRLDEPLPLGAIAVAICLSGTSKLTLGLSSWALAPERTAVLRKLGSLLWLGKGRQKLLVLETNSETLNKLGLGNPLRAGLAEASDQEPGTGFAEVWPAPIAMLTLAHHLSRPPLHAACLPIWYQAKVLELLSLALYSPAPLEQLELETPDEMAQRAALLLERDLENPPSLEMLAEVVGCGPFQLSRLFSKHWGRTIPEFLRAKRMELAAGLLRAKQLSVSEIALTVGYTSFSAFTRGFVREYGKTPTAFREQG
jgi:AraC family transcriptional regulator